MSDLIALVLDSREQAQEARLEFMKMQREHFVELEDWLVALYSVYERATT